MLLAAADSDDGELEASVRLVYEDLTSQFPTRAVVKETVKKGPEGEEGEDGDGNEGGPAADAAAAAAEIPSAVRNRHVEKQLKVMPLDEALGEYL